MIAQVLFVLCLAVTGFLAAKRIQFIRRNILLGRKQRIDDQPELRWRNMLLTAFGQRKMFDRPLVGIMHFVIYAGFLLVNVEMLEIVLDGILGTHRLFLAPLGSFYPILISFFETLAVGVIAVCVVFLWRRNVSKLGRFQGKELQGFPWLDANVILVTEIVLMCCLLTMNATDQVLQGLGNPHYHSTAPFLWSGMLTPLFNGLREGTLVILERGAWWIHILGVFAFAVYVTYSKHLHIGLAFPNTYYARLNPAGELGNMPIVSREVKSMLGLPLTEAENQLETTGSLGAKDINDLSWKQLMDAYSCTECGRCTSQCPANLTGKLLSPRKIMMDVRDRMEDVGTSMDKGGPGLNDGKLLYGDYISKEELMACTSCNACVDACPININPLDIIIDLRRYVAMEEGSMPASWNMMNSNLEKNFSPWALPASDRAKWTKQV